MNRIYDVFLCNERIRRSNGVMADQVAFVAVERGPLDPCVEPPNVRSRLGTFLAAGKAEAISQAKDRKNQPKPPRNRIRR